jgi:UPF0716 protein FxsA
MQAGRIPHREIVDGVLVIFGGAFLITPGFITDVIGVLLLLPPSRAIIRRSLARNFANRAVVRVFGGSPRRRRGGAGSAYDVDGTAVDIDPPPPLPR